LESGDVAAEGLADLSGLEGEFSGGDEEDGLDVVQRSVDSVEGGDDE
jgi:hypothetical protein